MHVNAQDALKTSEIPLSSTKGIPKKAEYSAGANSKAWIFRFTWLTFLLAKVFVRCYNVVAKKLKSLSMFD